LRAGRRVLYAARAERRRQDDHVADGDRAPQARSRLDLGLRRRCPRRFGRGQADHRLGLRRADDLRQADADGASLLCRLAVHRRHGRRRPDRRGHARRTAQPGGLRPRHPRGHLPRAHREKRGRMRPGGIAWLALHEARLSWRDWIYLITGGHSRRAVTSGLVFIVFVLFLHGVAYLMLRSSADLADAADTETLVVITGTLAMSSSLMLSQAL